MNYLFYRLVMFVNTSSKDDLNYTIADFILKNISDIADMNIVVFANTCHVSPASISRFCRKLGFDDYIHLKMECAKFTSSKLSEYVNPVMVRDPKKASKSYLTKTANHLLEQIELIDLHAMDELVEDIDRSNYISFFGSHFSHSIAELVQTTLFTTGKYSIAKSDFDQQIRVAETMDRNSLAIVLSVRGSYLKGSPRLKRAIEKSGAKTVLITANHDPKLLEEYDRVLYISSTDDLYLGRHLLLSYCEILSTKYVSRFSETK